MSELHRLAESITVNRARELILEAVNPVEELSSVDIGKTNGLVCAQDVQAANDLPTYTNSAMDGYAFRFDEIGTGTVTLPITGQSFAGNPCTQTTFAAKSCIEVTTGAAVPDAFDTVIAFEKCNIDSKARTITFDSCDIKKGANIRHKGEQIRTGDTIVAAGTSITPAHLALMAATGVATLAVYRRVVVAMIATGSELVEPGQPLGTYQTYDSNSLMLQSLIENLGCTLKRFEFVGDSAPAIAQTLQAALEDSDIVVMTGGAGNGRFDLSQTQLKTMGTLFPWTINMRPGRPMRFGTILGKPIFILPGNPVAAYVTFLEFARGAIRRMQGLKTDLWLREFPARLVCSVKKKPGRAEFMRGNLVGFDQGVANVEPITNQSSADLLALSRADVIIHLDHAPDHYNAGDFVRIQFLK